MGGITVSKLAERIGMDALHFLHACRVCESAGVHNLRQSIPQPLRGSSLYTREPLCGVPTWLLCPAVFTCAFNPIAVVSKMPAMPTRLKRALQR